MNLGLDFHEVPQVAAKWIHRHDRNSGFKMRMNDSAFRVVRRDEFDAWLADHMVQHGIELREQTTVTGRQEEADGVVVPTNHNDFRTKVSIRPA